MYADGAYDAVFEFWIPGVCLSGKVRHLYHHIIIFIHILSFLLLLF